MIMQGIFGGMPWTIMGALVGNEFHNGCCFFIPWKFGRWSSFPFFLDGWVGRSWAFYFLEVSCPDKIRELDRNSGSLRILSWFWNGCRYIWKLLKLSSPCLFPLQFLALLPKLQKCTICPYLEAQGSKHIHVYFANKYKKWMPPSQKMVCIICPRKQFTLFQTVWSSRLASIHLDLRVHRSWVRRYSGGDFVTIVSTANMEPTWIKWWFQVVDFHLREDYRSTYSYVVSCFYCFGAVWDDTPAVGSPLSDRLWLGCLVGVQATTATPQQHQQEHQ